LGKSKKTSFLVSVNREEEDLQAVVFADGVSGPIQKTVPTPARNTEISGSVNHVLGTNQLISIRGLYTDKTILNQGVGGFNLPEVATNFEDFPRAVRKKLLQEVADIGPRPEFGPQIGRDFDIGDLGVAAGRDGVQLAQTTSPSTPRRASSATEDYTRFVRPEYELGCDVGERRSREFWQRRFGVTPD